MNASSLTDSAIVVAADHLLASELGAEVVILNLNDGVYYSLDDVGARIWKLLESPVSMRAIRDAIVSEYDVDPTRCERDIRALVGRLASRGLVHVR